MIHDIANEAMVIGEANEEGYIPVGICQDKECNDVVRYWIHYKDLRELIPREIHILHNSERIAYARQRTKEAIEEADLKQTQRECIMEVEGMFLGNRIEKEIDDE